VVVRLLVNQWELYKQSAVTANDIFGAVAIAVSINKLTIACMIMKSVSSVSSEPFPDSA